MKITTISREVSHKINIGNYETICPTLRMTAEITEQEDVVNATTKLGKILVLEWTRVVILELRDVVRRRGGSVECNGINLETLLGSFKESFANKDDIPF